MSSAGVRYFELSDDMSTDQRWYLDDPEGPSGEWVDTAALNSCTRYDGPTPLRVRVHHVGPPLELTMSLYAVPIVNARVAEILSAHTGQDAQLIPTRVAESDENLWSVNVLAQPDCIDEIRTGAFRRWTPEDGRPDLVGRYRDVDKLRIDPVRAEGHAIFRPRDYWIPVIVSETLADALRQANVRCELKPVS